MGEWVNGWYPCPCPCPQGGGEGVEVGGSKAGAPGEGWPWVSPKSAMKRYSSAPQTQQLHDREEAQHKRGEDATDIFMHIPSDTVEELLPLVANEQVGDESGASELRYVPRQAFHFLCVLGHGQVVV